MFQFSSALVTLDLALSGLSSLSCKEEELDQISDFQDRAWRTHISQSDVRAGGDERIGEQRLGVAPA